MAGNDLYKPTFLIIRILVYYIEMMGIYESVFGAVYGIRDDFKIGLIHTQLSDAKMTISDIKLTTFKP